MSWNRRIAPERNPQDSPIGRPVAPSLPVFLDERASALIGRLEQPFTRTAGVADAELAVLVPHAAVVARLVERHPNLSILAIVPLPAQHGGSEHAVELLTSGAQACLIQPTPLELRAQLKALARRHTPSAPHALTA